MPDAVTRKKATPATTSSHVYHAEATAFKGQLFMPVEKTVAPQSRVTLDPSGGYKSDPLGQFNLEPILSYTSAYTQVSGIAGTKECKGHATLSTAVVEGLNILEILTCDRVVGQIATHHPIAGYTPEIVFLGTRFENLRIGGYPVNVTLDIDTIGPRPANDLHYLDEPGFVNRVAKYCEELHSYGNLPAPARKRYTGTSKTVGNQRSIDFSLVTKVSGDYPGRAFGHIIHVPHFGTIDLATVKINREDDGKTPPKTTVELKMLEVKLGCIGHGNGDVAFCKTSGGNPGG